MEREKKSFYFLGENTTNLSLIFLYTLLDLSVEYESVEKPLILNLNDWELSNFYSSWHEILK